MVITCPSTPLLLGSAATAGWTATDGGGSGLATPASGAVPLDTSTVGTKVVTAPEAKDNAGNVSAPASCTYSVRFDWDGFYQPIDNIPIVNLAKAGLAVPVKFSLGGDQGLNILAPGYPQSKQIQCATAGPLDSSELTLTAGASGLTYDASTDQYTYVWKTQKGWSGTCRQLVLKQTDGTEHVANFGFR